MGSAFLKGAAAALAMASCAVAFGQDATWRVSGGSAAVSLATQKLEGEGFSIVGMVPTAFGSFPMENAIGFSIDPRSDLRIATSKGNFDSHLGGRVVVKGGFFVRYGGIDYPMFNAVVRANGSHQEAPLLVDGGGSNFQSPTLNLQNVLTSFSYGGRRLTMGWADLKFTPEFLAKINRLDLINEPFGCYHISASLTPEGDPGGPPGGGGYTDLTQDVTLWRLNGLASLGRNGVAHPNGVSGLAMVTTSANLGTGNIPWFSPMNQNHPVIVQNAYAIRDGRLEQIGAAYLKHGFFATNTSDSFLPGGVHPGTGSLLGVNLTDTYGTGNNGDRNYLGPRSEVNPLAGTWTAWASLFDIGLPPNQPAPDGVRSYNGSGLPAHQFRVEVKDADFINQPAGNQFWYEGYYITPSDINTYNNIGVRKFTATWSGTSWSITNDNTGPSRVVHPTTGQPDPATTDNFYMEPMITRYAALMGGSATANKATDTSEGDAWVAINPINLGGGLYRYEVAVYNHNLDRQIREVRIPIMSGLTVSNIGYRDASLALGGWTGAYDNVNGVISWSTATHASNPNANSLKYGYVYSFWFTANIAPQANWAQLGLFKPRPAGSTLDNLFAVVNAPPNGSIVPATYTIIVGSLLGGNVFSLAESDDNRLRVLENPATEEVYTTRTLLRGVSPIASPSKLEFSIESQANLNGFILRTKLFNWTTNQYDELDTALTTTSDMTRTVTITGAANTANYIRPGTREMQVEIQTQLGIVDTTVLTELRIDRANWKLTY